MRVYTTNKFHGAYLGGNAVVVAKDKGHAKRLLMKAIGADPVIAPPDDDHDFEFQEVDTEVAEAKILFNGDYWWNHYESFDTI